MTESSPVWGYSAEIAIIMPPQAPRAAARGTSRNDHSPGVLAPEPMVAVRTGAGGETGKAEFGNGARPFP